MKSKINKYKIIAAISTLAIQLVLFAILNIDFSGLKDLTKQENNNQEFDIPLDQIMEDLSSIDEPSTEKTAEETVQKEDLIKQEIPAEPTFSESTSNKPADENNLVKEEPLKEIPPAIEHTKPVINDSVTENIVPAEIKKLFTDQNLTKTVNKQKKDNNYNARMQFYRQNYKAIRNLIKVYPYALRTREIIDSLNIRLTTTQNESEKKKMVNETERMLFKNYESAVRTMSSSQGRVLLKLIARETNKSGYDIIKEFKGGFSAGFWYSVGKLFNTDLKTEYHREAEDSVYEVILQKYKDGEFK